MEEQEASESSSVTIRRMEKGSHDWVLNNYFLYKEIGVKKAIKSKEFTVGGHRWLIYLYPGGMTVDDYNNGDASLFVTYKSSVPVQILYELYLLDQSGKGNHRDCHQSQEIIISDMEPSIFKAMLWFIYTGLLKEEEQKAASYFGSFMPNSFMAKMLAAADQFELKKLKKLCESRISEKLSGESVAYLLHIADLNHATELKVACLRFAAENQDAVLESDGYEYLKQNCPSLFLELAYKENPSSSGGEELNFCSKIVSAVKESFASLFFSQGASDMMHKIKES
ncbi:hypothetical protein DH2020_019037 [Rehmannia glutinosa]|uniref:MATH domain-containing protein n=1 Tax=Rehmannia glutinosa TaxID=99300 RepID=A0ABR0WQ02_REHGL